MRRFLEPTGRIRRDNRTNGDGDVRSGGNYLRSSYEPEAEYVDGEIGKLVRR
jgi:hypothetical protein